MDTDRINKIRFRSWRRGFREADLILGPFADSVVPTLTDIELDDLERLLDQADQDLYAWIIGMVETPAAYDTAMMTRLKAFRFDALAARQDLGA